MRSGRAAAFFGANSSRPTGSFRQRQKTQKVYTMCSAQSVYHVPVLTGTRADAWRWSGNTCRDESRHGTHKCVRHVNMAWLCADRPLADG